RRTLQRTRRKKRKQPGACSATTTDTGRKTRATKVQPATRPRDRRPQRPPQATRGPAGRPVHPTPRPKRKGGPDRGAQSTPRPALTPGRHAGRRRTEEAKRHRRPQGLHGVHEQPATAARQHNPVSDSGCKPPQQPEHGRPLLKTQAGAAEIPAAKPTKRKSLVAGGGGSSLRSHRTGPAVAARPKCPTSCGAPPGGTVHGNQLAQLLGLGGQAGAGPF